MLCGFETIFKTVVYGSMGDRKGSKDLWVCECGSVVLKSGNKASSRDCRAVRSYGDRGAGRLCPGAIHMRIGAVEMMPW